MGNVCLRTCLFLLRVVTGKVAQDRIWIDDYRETKSATRGWSWITDMISDLFFRYLGLYGSLHCLSEWIYSKLFCRILDATIVSVVYISYLNNLNFNDFKGF